MGSCTKAHGNINEQKCIWVKDDCGKEKCVRCKLMLARRAKG